MFKKRTERDFKSKSGFGTIKNFKDLLREKLLAQQREARTNHVDRIRELADKAFQSEGKNDADSMEVDQGRKRHVESDNRRRARIYYASQLMYPEWLNDVPSDLATNWYISPRPEGGQCLVIAYRGSTVSRKKNGTVLHRFESQLPNGSRTTRAKDSPTVLDCIYHAPSRTYYIVDMMCWKGYCLYDCDTDFRQHWMRQQLSSTTISVVSKHNGYCFKALPFRRCTPEAFAWAYQVQLRLTYDTPRPETHTEGFKQDGILFLHSQTHYVAGSSPLCLTWKDSWSSSYMVATTDGTTISNQQTIVLQLSKDATSLTALHGEVISAVPNGFVDETKSSPGDLVKLAITDATEDAKGNPVVAGMKYIGKGSRARVLADAWSKILFQANARHNRCLSADNIHTALSVQAKEEVLRRQQQQQQQQQQVQQPVLSLQPQFH